MLKKKSIYKKFYKHIIIFLIFLVAGNSLINFSAAQQKNRYLKMQTELLNTKYKTNYKYFKIMSKDIYSIYKENQQVLSIMKKAKDADTKERDTLRQKLYNKLKRRYKRLQNMGILQLHFHFADNTSFLRMHKPEKYGDDLSSVRKSVALTNETQQPHDGFEVGKANHGFRFVYPLFYQKEHLGSMEVSFSSAKLLSAVLDNFIIHTHFLIAKEEILNHIWEDDRASQYEQSLESLDYLLESSTHKRTNEKNIHQSILNKKSTDKISKMMKLGKDFSIVSIYNYESVVGTFIPILNAQNTKTIAFLAVYTESDYLDSLEMEKQYIKLLFISILLMLFIFSIYVTINNIRLREMAHFDELTSLPNRAFFYIALEIELTRAKRNSSQLALMFIDLDGFKAVNDNYGHDIGDILLQEVSQRLTHCIRNVDAVARLGGDEFTIILTDLKHKENALLVANKVIKRLSEDFILNKQIINIGASIGISLYPDLALDSDTLVKQSDSAMYIAKENGKNQAIFYTEN